jgi:hypothetical protein
MCKSAIAVKRIKPDAKAATGLWLEALKGDN